VSHATHKIELHPVDGHGALKVMATKRLSSGFAITATGESEGEAIENLATLLVETMERHGVTSEVIRARSATDRMDAGK
jgi:hypothetical protein